MKIQQFLEHHGLSENPFSQEDAQTDPLFQKVCSHGTFHPAWDKIFGDPGTPATAVVFGEKGSGKTALRLQIVEHTARYNQQHPDNRVFVVEYDDFNPFLDCFHGKLGWQGAKPERVLAKWRLWDHIDSILSLAVTRLIDDIINERTKGQPGPFEVRGEALQRLTAPQKRDLLMLAAFYDRSTDITLPQRWTTVRRKLRFSNWKTWKELAIGTGVSLGLFGLLANLGYLPQFGTWWPWAILFVAWAPWLWRQARVLWLGYNVKRQVRVLDRQLGTLRGTLSRIEQKDLNGQPTPARERSDDRYELLVKLQGILKVLGFDSMMILVDRVDEPHLINGSPERMKALLWPMFDNKFLKHTGLGFKLLLPAEVSLFLQREDKEFYERSRLDKQNLIRSLEWTGESLYDLANDRIRAGGASNGSPSNGGASNGSATQPPAPAGTEPSPRKLQAWFEDSITEQELIGTLARLRVPRHLFKFLHRLLVEHCHRYTDESPRWQIGRETLQSTMALYMRDLEAYDRGLGTG